jgi:hypothetical protein
MTRHNAALNHQRDTEHQARVDKAIVEATGATTNQDDDGKTYLLDPEGAQALRGIPAVGGRGTLGGHIAGTRPDYFINEDRRRL